MDAVRRPPRRRPPLPVLRPLPPRPRPKGRDAPAPTLRSRPPACVVPRAPFLSLLSAASSSTSICASSVPAATARNGRVASGARVVGGGLCRVVRFSRIRVITASSASWVPFPTTCEVRPSARRVSGRAALEPGMTPSGFLPSKSGLVWTSAHCKKGCARRVWGEMCSSVSSESN